MYIDGMQGLGDNIYQRAVVREVAGQVYLRTPWPQLYADLPNVHPVNPNTRLRTQAKNTARGWPWAEPPIGVPVRRISYTHRPESILTALARELRVTPRTFDLPAMERVAMREPYIVIRPATVRAEWRADSRNPDPSYLARVAELAKSRFNIISLADLEPGKEWALEPLPFAHRRYHSGEFPIERVLRILAGAAGVVGGVGWALPAAIALRVPMLLVYGGWGGHNGPARILDAAMDTRLLTQVFPDNFCMCERNSHDCNKTIRNFDEHARDWLDRLAEHRAPAVVP